MGGVESEEPMHASVRDFIARELPLIQGPRVCELGSYDVNGSARPQVAVLKPVEYVGVDLRPGPGVDVVCDVCCGGLAGRYGAFDLVISTETLEHVQSWPLFVRAMKRLCKPGGHILLTARSPGFALHDFPGDYWRFTEDNMREAFADCEPHVEHDPEAPGVFMHAIKPINWQDYEAAWVQAESP